MIWPYVLTTFAAIVTIRSFWVASVLEMYEFCSLHYLTMNQLSDGVGVEMAELWPRSYMYWEWHHWDFPRYVVHQDHYDAMCDWMDVQLARTDLDYSTFRKELDAVEAAALASAQ